MLIGSFAFILAALFLFGPTYLPYSGVREFVFIALAYAIVDLGVPSKIMLSKGMLREEVGTYIIKSSVINVTAGLGILTILVMINSATLENLVVQILSIAGFTAVFFILHEFIHRIDDYVVMLEETEAQFAITFALLLFLAYTTEAIGLSSVLGAFFAGVIISRSDFSESHAFQEKINAIGEGLFIPIFFAWFGLGLQIFAPSVLFTTTTILLLFVLIERFRE